MVLARGSSLMNLHGIGPSGAARLLADVGDIRRFADRDRFASWNGTAPIDASSGPEAAPVVPGREPPDQPHSAHHGRGATGIPTEGRTYFDAKQAAGKTSMESMRALKRRLSNVVHACMVQDQLQRQAASPGGHSGTTLQSSVTDLTPDVGSSDKPLPGPASSQPKPAIPAVS